MLTASWVQADVVLGLRNEGSETYNISMIAGSLNSPVDFSVFVQNFTQMVSRISFEGPGVHPAGLVCQISGPSVQDTVLVRLSSAHNVPDMTDKQRVVKIGVRCQRGCSGFGRAHTQGYGQTVAPGEEISLEYKFQPDPRLEPRDFIVSLTAFYSDSKGQWYSSTFFNETVNIVEVKKLIDWELLFLILLFTAGLAAAGEEHACAHTHSRTQCAQQAKDSPAIAHSPLPRRSTRRARTWMLPE